MLVVYGATGYTGRLVVAEALVRGLRPTLAGRNADAVRAQAGPLGVPWRAAALDDARALDAALAGADHAFADARRVVRLPDAVVAPQRRAVPEVFDTDQLWKACQGRRVAS